MFELASFGGHRFKNGCLDAGCSTQPPQDARQSKHQLALHGRFGVVVGNHGGFEGLVVLGILERRNDGLSGETVAYGIAARTVFAFRRYWSGAFERIAAIGCDLFERYSLRTARKNWLRFVKASRATLRLANMSDIWPAIWRLAAGAPSVLGYGLSGNFIRWPGVLGRRFWMRLFPKPLAIGRASILRFSHQVISLPA